MANEGLTFEIGADTRRIESALQKFEQSTDSLARKLDTGFGLLDARIGLLRGGLAAIQDQVGKSGNALSKFLKILGAFSGIAPIEETGKALADLSDESAQAEKNIAKFTGIEPRGLLKTFKELVSQAAILRTATKEQLSVFGTDEDVAAIVATQEQLVRGLTQQSERRRRELRSQIDNETVLGRLLPNANFENRGSSIEKRRRLDETLQVLKEISAIADNPSVRSRIDDVLRPRSAPRFRQGGALEPRSPREVELASSETGIARATGQMAGAAERTDQALSQQLGTIRKLDGAARDLGFTFASSFEDAVVEGRNLSDVLQGLERDILRILTRKLVTEPLAGAVTGLIGSGIGAFAGQFHGGGQVGSTPVPGRVVPASFFDGAPRFAGGGMVGRVPSLAPGEVPAILHRGEIVRTPAQEAALRRNGGSSGETRIVVNIQTPNPRAFNESRGQIQAMLADAVSAGRRNR